MPPASTLIASIVQTALLHFDNQRYRLLAWCIMPNHVHVLIETREGFRLSDILHSWKSFTAKEINRTLNRTGTVWMREYHDRYIRDDVHLASARRYIEENPVAGGLVARAELWEWSCAGEAARMAAVQGGGPLGWRRS